MPSYFVRLTLRGSHEGEYDAENEDGAIEHALEAWTEADIDADVAYVAPVVENA